MSVLSGIDFFTVEVLTWRGLATYYVLFLIQLDTRRVTVAGLTRHPTEEWMQQMARNITDESSGVLSRRRYLIRQSRCQILRIVPVNADGRRCGSVEVAATEPEPERVWRALGAIYKTGMLIQADPDR